MQANTGAPALSATCHALRLLHKMLCSRPHVFCLDVEDGQMCTGIGGTAARSLNLINFIL